MKKVARVVGPLLLLLLFLTLACGGAAPTPEVIVEIVTAEATVVEQVIITEEAEIVTREIIETVEATVIVTAVPTDTSTPRPVNPALLTSQAMLAPSPTRGPTRTPLPPTEDLEPVLASTFQSFQRALSQGNGTAFADLLATDTLDWMDDQIADAGTDGFATEWLVDHLFVLRLRHEYVASELDDLTPRQAFIRAVELQWLSGEFVSTIDPHTVHYNNIGPYIPLPDTDLPLFYFHFENGSWRISLSALLVITNFALQDLADDEGLSGDEFLVQLVELESGRPVDPVILDGPRPG